MAPRRWIILAGAVVLTVAGLAVPGHAATRVEAPVATTSPVREVVESVVRLRLPLPGTGHPPECDWVSYLRFRHRNGPAESARADRILIAQPGVLEGAAAFDGVARNTIVEAAGKGRYVEFWALDRRSNCLEDNTGVRAGLAARDAHLAVDYYYRKKAVGGRTFAGYLSNDQVRFLQDVGIERTVRDQYELMRRELPDPAVRREKVLCGGHSLGGMVTGYFAVWDFDGNHSTTADAGYNQCSGYFALDSRIQAGGIGLERLVPSNVLPEEGTTPDLIRLGLELGIIPRTLSAPAVINAETMNLLAIAGLAARNDPDGESRLSSYIPAGFNQDTTYRLLFSKDYATFLRGTPTVRDFRFSNEAALGGLMDDNSVPLGFVQTSVGFFDGGRITDKDFPLPNDLAGLPPLEPLKRLVGTGKKAIPDEPGGPLYTWRNYDRVGAPDDPVHKGRDGKPFTTASDEVTDIGQLARSLAEHPLDFTEDYFPTRLVTDIALGDHEDAVHAGGIAANPTILLLAGEGVLPPPEPQEGVKQVVAPGYQHLDVLTAAAVQNGGRPERISVELAAFAAG
ncbi:hypothetical protein [Spirillospora sp. NPDC029432]|uniref:hypothetical protein n=1 Tax=Spirillospora sp. NPDC029432 TaxID=3154599 RepID=UPI003455A9AD